MRGSTCTRPKITYFAPGERALIGHGHSHCDAGRLCGLRAAAQRACGSARVLTIVNTPGLIDSGYRGELKVIGLNTDAREHDSISSAASAVAQLVIQEVPVVTIDVVDELDATERGEGGFGSTGKK